MKLIATITVTWNGWWGRKYSQEHKLILFERCFAEDTREAFFCGYENLDDYKGLTIMLHYKMIDRANPATMTKTLTLEKLSFSKVVRIAVHTVIEK